MMTAVDQELINSHANFPDTFVSGAHANIGVQGHGAGGGGTAAAAAAAAADPAGAGPSTSRVAQFYLQVLAESFARDLPSARRGVEQLGAVAGRLVD